MISSSQKIFSVIVFRDKEEDRNCTDVSNH